MIVFRSAALRWLPLADGAFDNTWRRRIGPGSSRRTARATYLCWRGLSQQEAAMPAKSKAQQKAAGAALSAKRGEQKVSELKGASREMYKSMSERQLEEFAETRHKGKPEHVKR
jgi:hypothetical protein